MENEISCTKESLRTYKMIESQASLTREERRRISAVARYQYDDKLNMSELDSGLSLIERFVVVRPAIILHLDGVSLKATHLNGEGINYCYLAAVMKKKGLMALLHKLEGSFCMHSSSSFTNFYIDNFYSPLFGIDTELTLFQEEKLNYLPERSVLFQVEQTA